MKKRDLAALALALALLLALGACSPGTKTTSPATALSPQHSEVPPTQGAPETEEVLAYVAFVGLYLHDPITQADDATGETTEWGLKTFLWEQAWLAALQDGLYEVEYVPGEADNAYWDAYSSAQLEPGYVQGVADEVYAFPVDVAAWGTDEDGFFPNRGGYSIDVFCEPDEASYTYGEGVITAEADIYITNPGDEPIPLCRARYTLYYRPAHRYQPYQLFSVELV